MSLVPKIKETILILSYLFFLCNTYEIRIYILTSRTRGMQVTVR